MSELSKKDSQYHTLSSSASLISPFFSLFLLTLQSNQPNQCLVYLYCICFAQMNRYFLTFLHKGNTLYKLLHFIFYFKQHEILTKILTLCHTCFKYFSSTAPFLLATLLQNITYRKVHTLVQYNSLYLCNSLCRSRN